MEMIANNKEKQTIVSLLAPGFFQSSSLRAANRQQPANNQPKIAETDFSERLSAAMDDSGKRTEISGKVLEKRELSKVVTKDSEQMPAAVSTNPMPAAIESDAQASTSGVDPLTELKNAALQGLAAVAAPVLPILVQQALPTIAAASAVTAVASGIASVVTGLFNQENGKAVQNPQQAVETPVMQGRIPGAAAFNTFMPADKASVMSELSQKPLMNPNPNPNSNLDSNPPPMVEAPIAPLSVVKVQSGGMTDEMTLQESVLAKVSNSSPDNISQQTQHPVQGRQPALQPENQPALNTNQQDNMLQRQIQQDLHNATITSVVDVPQIAAVVTKPSVEPALATKPEPVDTDNLETLPGTVEPTTETVVKPAAGQELTKRFMSDSDTDPEAGLSEKNDASLTAPVGFDKVMASVNEPATVTPPVAQPRPDLHEVVKQVMDGMISPSQQLKSSQVIITLKPEHLGEVTVKINVDGDKVTAAFHAASSEVRGILESSLPQLKQEMSQQGWQFDSDGVFGGMQEFLAQQQQQQQAQQQQMRSMINHARPDEYDDAMAFSSSGKLQVMSATAVDYRV